MAAALIAGLATASVVAPSASAVDVEHYVDPAGADVGNCQNIAEPCQTINYAVSQAGEGDIINVAAGTYDEDVLVTKSLVFRGANAGVSAGVDAGARGPESVVRTFRTGTGTSVIDAFGTTPVDVTIDGFTLDAEGDAALQSATLHVGLIHLLGGPTSGTTIVNNVVSGADAFHPSCNAFGCAAPNQMAPIAIVVGSGEVNIADNRVQNFRYGPRVSQQVGRQALVATIDGNVVTGVTVQGISVGGATGVQQPGATVTGNQVDATGQISGPVGIVVSNANNVITGNQVTDFGRGVSVILCKKFDTRNNTVDDNTFVNAPLVVAVSTDGGQCSTGSGGDTEGVGSWVPFGGRFDGFNANGNTFSGGTVAFSSSASAGFSPNKPVTPGPLDITCYFWGSETGPTNANNPGGTGLVVSYSTSSNQPEYDFTPWEIADGGACSGGQPTGPVVSIGDQSGLERDLVTGSVFLPVYLSEPVAEPVVVSFYTVDGTAIQGQDYTRWGTPAIPRTVTIPAGQLLANINVPVLVDDQVEDDETFSVVLAGVSGGGAVIGDDTGIGTIVDSDGLYGPNPVINVSNVQIYEGDQGQRRAQFQIHLSRAPLTNVTINYTTSDGTAVAGTDYITKFPGTVQFAPGQISKTVDVLVNSNTGSGADRDFFLNVGVTGGSPVEELNMSGVGTIVDDD